MTEQRKYVGARYVPLIMGEWDSTATYEPLSVVLHNGKSYTSRTFVPAGISLTNEVYWALSGGFNADEDVYTKSYDTVADMQADTTLSAGMIAHTLGFHEAGDGGGAWYKVGSSGDIALDNGLYSILENVDDAGMYTLDAGMYALDVRNNIIGTIDLPASNAYIQVHTIINDVLYYAYTYSGNCYLYSVPFDFSEDPTFLETFAGIHPTCMGSVNANMLVLSYPDGFVMYDIANGTYTTKTSSNIWGFTVDRKTDDASVHPDLLVAYTAMNTGIVRYGHTDDFKYQPVFYINPSSVSGHLQDTASYGDWVFQLLVGAPGLKSNVGLPYRYNYLYVFNSATGNPLFLAPIICNYEVEGISVRSLGANGNATLVISDVAGNVYQVSAKIQPSSVGEMFPGYITKKPIVRLNANNATFETVTDAASATRNIITQFKFADRLIDQIFANDYRPYVVNGGSRCTLYIAITSTGALNNVYTLATNGTYMAYNRSGNTNTFNLASIYNSGSNKNSTYDSTTKTIDDTFANVRVTGNSAMPSASEGYFLPDISFD